MSKPDPRIKQIRQEAKAEKLRAKADAAALAAGIDVDNDDEEDVEITGTDGQRRRIRMKGAGPKRMRALGKTIKKLIEVNDKQDGEIDAIRTEILDIIERFHAEAKAYETNAMGMWSQVKPWLSVGISLMNQSDKVQAPMFLTVATSMEQLALSTQYAENAGGRDFLTTLSAFARAFAYYDAKVGLASIWTADAANASATPTRVYA